MAIVTVAADGTNSIVVIPGANRCHDIEQVASAAVATVGPGDVVLAQLELPPAVVHRAFETRGAEAVVATDDDGTFAVPARPATAIDTTGAGDCFTGVLVAGLAAGRPQRSSNSRAIVAASLQVGRVGAAPAMPDAAEIDAALS